MQLLIKNRKNKYSTETTTLMLKLDQFTIKT